MPLLFSVFFSVLFGGYSLLGISPERILLPLLSLCLLSLPVRVLNSSSVWLLTLIQVAVDLYPRLLPAARTIQSDYFVALIFWGCFSCLLSFVLMQIVLVVLNVRLVASILKE